MNVVGVSKDTAKSHVKFIAAESLNFPLLADPEKTMCEAFGVLKEKNMYGKTTIGVSRTTFLADAKGKLVKVYENVKVEGHVEQVLADAKELLGA